MALSDQEMVALGRNKGWDGPLCSCGSADPTKWGWRYNATGPKQRWRCQACRRTFVEDDGFLGRRAPTRAIAAAWDLYFRGVSLAGIARHLRVAWRVRVSPRTVLEWVRAYSRLLADYADAVLAERKVDGGTRWHEDLAVLRCRGELRYVGVLRGRGPTGRPILLEVRYMKDRGERHAVGLLKAGLRRAREPPGKVVSDKEWIFRRAHRKVFGWCRRRVRMVHGVPIACRRHGLRHNNHPAEQSVREVEDWRRGRPFVSDASAADLVRGLWVHANVVNTHGRERTWAERAGLRLGLPKEDRVRVLIERAARWRKSGDVS